MTQDKQFGLTFKVHAKHKRAAQSLLTTNAIIQGTYYPNPYSEVKFPDHTYLWSKGLPLAVTKHRSHTVNISAEGKDFVGVLFI